MEAGEFEAEVFLVAHADVETLDGLACCALHQIVGRGHDDQPIGMRITFESDIAVIASGEQFRFRIAMDSGRFLDDPHEWLVLVGRPVDCPDLFIGQGFVQIDV